MAEPAAPAPMWKRVVASILDFIMAFAVCGYLIGAATGGLALIVAYFYVGRRVAGGTLWDRFFGIKRPQPR